MNEFDILKKLLEKDRSCRRFIQKEKISEEVLKQLVALTVFCASGRNLQPLRYKLLNTKEECDKIFPTLAWAGYLPDWPGPEEGERPSAYIIQCLDKDIATNCLCDDGLNLQAITLGATALGLGCCIIKAFNKEQIKNIFNLPEKLDPLYVLALGVKAENIIVENYNPVSSEPYKYYRDKEGNHHVPKRQLKDLLIP